MMPLILWHTVLDTQLRLALAMLAAWERAPIVPQLEPEVRAAVARRAMQTAGEP